MSRGKIFLEEFKARGLFYQATNEQGFSLAVDDAKAPSAYIGFDCTATSLHVGNLMQVMILRLLQKHKIKPIVLIGGATTKIGDPTGKDSARKVLSDSEAAENIKGIKHSFSKFIKFGDGPYDAVMLNNSDWLESINYMDFLQHYGRHFSVNRMISFDSVKPRLEEGKNLSFLEFNYMILQAYDFYHLNKTHGCILQCGGSDQWGNIVNGVELARRVNSVEVFGITTPLITTASGAKMGKTEQGAVWLNEDLLSPYNYYQFWRNADDRDIFKFMRIYTDLSLEEIEKYEADKATNINEFKKILAYEATMLCHGVDAAEKAQKAAISAFESQDMEDIESVRIQKSSIEEGIFLYELFVLAGLASSNGEGRRLIAGKGARLNNEKIEDERYKVTMTDFKNGAAILSSGKKHHVKLEPY